MTPSHRHPESFDARRIREDFPIFSRKVRGRPLVYLDSAATTQKPRAVLEAVKDFYERCNANVHRGVHTLSEEATARVEESREKVARFIGAPKPHTLIFTRNTTESINLVAYAWGRKNLGPKDEVLLTELEHHSNLVPWQILSKEKGVRLRFVPVTDDGRITVEAARKAITPRTRLFSFTAMSNALGSVSPVRELVSLAHAQGALALVDGAQWVPHRKTDVAAWDCDFLAFSAHKMLGPSGVGALYGRESVLDAMDPFLGGGDMIREVWLDHADYNILPHKFEAGTPAIAEIVGFGAAVDYLEAVGLDALRAHEDRLVRRACAAAEAEGVVLYGPRDLSDRTGVLSFNVADIHPHDVGQVFDMEGVAVRVGHHCCQPLMRRLGIGGTARASFYLYNDEEDAEAFARALRRVKDFFKVGGEAAKHG